MTFDGWQTALSSWQSAQIWLQQRSNPMPGGILKTKEWFNLVPRHVDKALENTEFLHAMRVEVTGEHCIVFILLIISYILNTM